MSAILYYQSNNSMHAAYRAWSKSQRHGCPRFRLHPCAKVSVSSLVGLTLTPEPTLTHSAASGNLGFCGCRPGCKKFLAVWECDRVRSSVRPHCAAFSEATGRYGDQRIGSKSLRRARGSEPKTGFPNPDLFDHFAHSGHRLLTPSFRFQMRPPASF